MSPNQESYQAIAQLLEQYCWSVDHKLWDEWAQCFTPEGIFEVRGQKIQGRHNIVQYTKESIGRYPFTRHLLYLPAISVLDSNEASSRCYFEFKAYSASNSEVEALGTYEDSIVHTPTGWNFRTRKVRFDYFTRRGGPWNSGGDV